MKTITERQELEGIVRREFKRMFARRLVSAMYERKITNADLSDATMIPKATISRYCKGNTCPSAYNIYKLSFALDKPVSYFYS